MNLIGITYNQTPSDPLSITAIIVAVITAIWSLISYIIRKNIDKKCQEQIETIKTQNQKELAEYKSELTKQIDIFKIKNKNITYITKTQFDAEFKMYQELSSDSYNVVQSIKKFDSTINEKATSDYGNAKEFLAETQKYIYKLNKSINKYAPFIQKEKYDLLQEFNTYLFKMFIFKETRDVQEGKTKIVEVENIIKNYKEIMKQVNFLHENFINNLRVYLDSLKIIEDK